MDDTEEITYVAEANIVVDEKPKEIVHPLVDYFFGEPLYVLRSIGIFYAAAQASK